MTGCSRTNPGVARQAGLTLLATVAVLIGLSCGGDITGPGTGSLAITTATTGELQDLDGYLVALDGGSGEVIGENATLTVANLSGGKHTAQLSGVAAYCTVSGNNLRNITVVPDATTDVSFAVTCPAIGTVRLEKVSGDGQVALAGTELPGPLVVQVLDAQQDPIPNRAVTWGTGDGSVTPQNATTDAQGEASTRWTVKSSPGSNTVDAVVSGVGTVTFTATGTAGVPSASNSTVTASPQSMIAGLGTSTITVTVRDGNDNVVSGVPVELSSSGTGNEITPQTAASNESGVASFTFSSIVAETKSITATAGGVELDEKPAITVVKAHSTTRIGLHDPDPSTAGQPLRVEFTVTGQGGGTPTGDVTVRASSSEVCIGSPAQGFCNLSLTASGSRTISVSYAGDARFDGSADESPHQVLPGPPEGIAAFSGDAQVGAAGTTLAQPLVVLVFDAFGNPVAGVMINWSVTGGGSVSQTSTTTDENGRASVERTLGTSVGEQATSASVNGLAGSPVRFVHTATAGRGTQVRIVSGNDQSAPAGSQLGAPLVVEVLDALNNPVPGLSVTWVIGTGGGSVAPQANVTDTHGRASANWTLGASAGSNTLNAVVSGVGTVAFTATGS